MLRKTLPVIIIEEDVILLAAVWHKPYARYSMKHPDNFVKISHDVSWKRENRTITEKKKTVNNIFIKSNEGQI